MGLGGRDDIERYLERTSSLVLGLQTHDFSMIHDIVRICKDMDITLHILEFEEPTSQQFDCLIVDEGSTIPIKGIDISHLTDILETAEMTVDRAIARSMDRERPGKMIVGIDPGKRPGMAFLLDGILVKISRTSNDEMVLDRIISSIEAFKPSSMLVRIGDGAPRSRDTITDSIKIRKIPMELVDERRTTTGKKFRDEAAAVMIAQTEGEPL